MEHGKYVGVRKESRRDGVCTLKGQTLYLLKFRIMTRREPALNRAGAERGGETKSETP